MYGRKQKLLVHAWIVLTSNTFRLDLNRCNLELAFNSRELRSICEHEPTAKDALGAEIAEALRRRLADLRAATSIADLIVGNPHTVEVGSKNYPLLFIYSVGTKSFSKQTIQRIRLQIVVSLIGQRSAE